MSAPISPMSSERLFAIEETARNHSGPVSRLIYNSDVTALVAEVRRLRKLHDAHCAHLYPHLCDDETVD